LWHPTQLSVATISEKWAIEFKVTFHYWFHTLYALLTQKMNNSGFCATNIEKFHILERHSIKAL
jgi:hypothetical protein